MSNLKFKRLTHPIEIAESADPIELHLLSTRQIAYLVQLIGEKNIQSVIQIMQEGVTDEQSIAFKVIGRALTRNYTKLAYLNGLRPQNGEAVGENLQKQIDDTVAELDTLERQKDELDLAVSKQRAELFQGEIFRLAYELPDKILTAVGMLLGLSKYDTQKQSYEIDKADMLQLEDLSAVSAMTLLNAAFISQSEGFAAAFNLGKKSSSTDTENSANPPNP